MLLLLYGCRKPIRGGGGIGKMTFRTSKKKKRETEEDDVLLVIAALYSARNRAGKRRAI